MSGGMGRLARTLDERGRERFQARRATGTVEIARVVRLSNGDPERVIGPLDGAGEVQVPVRGVQLAEGMAIRVSYDGTRPGATDYVYEGIESADAAGAGQVVADILPPEFDAPPFSTRLVPGGGRERDHDPLSRRRAAIGPGQLPRLLPPGGRLVGRASDPAPGRGADGDAGHTLHTGDVGRCQVADAQHVGARRAGGRDAHLHGCRGRPGAGGRDRAAGGHGDAPPGRPRGARHQGPGRLRPVALRGGRGRGRRGAGDVHLAGQYTYLDEPGTYYAAVRALGRSGVEGPRYPAGGFVPFNIIGIPLADTIPPPAHAAPQLQPRSVQLGDGSVRGYLGVAIQPGYPFPTDYARTIVRLQNGGAVEYRAIEGAATETELQVGSAPSPSRSSARTSSATAAPTSGRPPRRPSRSRRCRGRPRT
jgi:hypothetical protein